MPVNATILMRLLEFTDSAFPVGSFSFSNGIETAAGEGLIHDAATLEAYTRDIARQAAFTDGVAALHALRSCRAGRYDGILRADSQTIRCKLNAEARLMTCRMGRKLAELSQHIFSDPTAARWLGDIAGGRTPGTYPVAQGIVFGASGIPEKALFCAHLYGVASTTAGAALRCVRVSHYETQRILFRAAEWIGGLYAEARELELDDMHAFAPQADILASLHEKGARRMFMN